MVPKDGDYTKKNIKRNMKVKKHRHRQRQN